MRIPIITQNFISPHQNGTSDLYGTQPLMLLPQSQQTIFDGQQQNSFNNLFLHDLNRHRTTYIRSYNAYETVKKRQDFVLRKENLKSLYRIEDRLERKKEQHIGQTLHAYEQCFVKVINNNPYSSIIGQRPRTAAPIQLQVQLPVAFDKFHSHHLSHSNPAIKTEQDSNSQQQQRPQTSVSQQAFYRYQKNHRPKFKQSNVIYKTVQSFHDACLQQQQQQKQPVVQHQSKDFLSFTESYLQKFDNNSFPNAKQTSSTIIWQKPCGNERQRPLSAVPSFESVTAVDTKNKKHRQQEQDVTIKVAIQQRTKTPRSSPILDAVENEIQLNDDAHSDEGKKLRQKPFGSKNNNTQSLITNLTTGNDKKSTVITTTDDDIVKEAMFIRNYNEPKTTPTSSVINSQAKSTITVHQKSSPSSSTVIRRRLSVSSSTSKLLKSSTNSQLVETELTVIAKQPEELIVESMQQQSQEQGIKEKKDDDEIGTVHNTKLIKKLPLPNKRTKTSAFDKNSETLNDMVIFEHGLNDKSKNSRDNVDDEENVMMKNDNGITDLLEKIKQGTNPLLLGQTALSQQGCRFELPYDLKQLEKLKPTEYLSRYCRLSSRRQYLFRRIFDKFCNNNYRVEVSNLYNAIMEIHANSFNQDHWNKLLKLIGVREETEVTFDVFAGITALCGRLLYNEQKTSTQDSDDFHKDILERCDFENLHRKLDGLNIPYTIRQLLHAL